MSILISMDAGVKNSTKPKLTRKKCLEFSLDLLIKEGNTKLRIDTLVQSLGVTKGSFYWHFKDRDDFIFKLVEHWTLVSTQVVVEHMKQSCRNCSPKYDLESLIVHGTCEHGVPYAHHINSISLCIFN
jgi:AcrR family transcriptional regulator